MADLTEKINELNGDINNMNTTYCIVVHDDGENYQITGSGRSIESTLVDGIVVIVNNFELWNYINNLLTSGKVVSYPKTCKEVCKDMLIIKEGNLLEEYKNAIYYKAINRFNLLLSPIYLFEFYSFFNINNSLMNRGYYITVDNKEEKYLEIINANDEGLLNLLEKYLYFLDKLEIINYKYKLIEKLKTDLNNATQETEVDEIANVFFKTMW